MEIGLAIILVLGIFIGFPSILGIILAMIYLEKNKIKREG